MENCKLQKKKGKKKNVNTLVIFLNIKPFLNYLSLNMEKKTLFVWNKLWKKSEGRSSYIRGNEKIMKIHGKFSFFPLF